LWNNICETTQKFVYFLAEVLFGKFLEKLKKSIHSEIFEFYFEASFFIWVFYYIKSRSPIKKSSEHSSNAEKRIKLVYLPLLERGNSQLTDNKTWLKMILIFSTLLSLIFCFCTQPTFVKLILFFRKTSCRYFPIKLYDRETRKSTVEWSNVVLKSKLVRNMRFM
jgi:hypothetical protein